MITEANVMRQMESWWGLNYFQLHPRESNWLGKDVADLRWKFLVFRMQLLVGYLGSMNEVVQWYLGNFVRLFLLPARETKWFVDMGITEFTTWMTIILEVFIAFVLPISVATNTKWLFEIKILTVTTTNAVALFCQILSSTFLLFSTL